MLVSKKIEFKSSDDVELGIKRECDPDFVLVYDDEKHPKAFVFVLQGWGASADDKFLSLYLKYFAKHYDLAMISVNYHAIYNRFPLGADFILDSTDKKILVSELGKIGLSLSPELLDKEIAGKDIYALTDSLNYELERLKRAGRLSADFRLKLHTSIRPLRNEYQNFGVLAALDILNAALCVQRLFKAQGGGIPIILTGESYGAYLSMLCAKFAPWLVDGVIENSGGAQMLWWHSGVGKEVDFTKFIELSPIYTYANLAIYTSTRSFWTLDESSPNYFSPERKAIRELLHKEHLSTQAHYAKPLYTCYHCKFDTIASFEAKSKLVKELENLGFNVDFKAIIDESQVDKKFIQNLSHGMDIPLKMLIEKELFVMLERLKKHKKTKCAKSISYACGNLLYTFYEEKGQMQLKIERTK